MKGMDTVLKITDKNGLTEEEFLKNYKPGDYERPSVTVDIVIFGLDAECETLKTLLIQRKGHPYLGCWAFPGGFVDMNESTYAAAVRELQEETGLTDVYLEQLYTFSDPKRDPRMRVIDVAYLALIPVCPATAGDDASDAAWFNVQFEDDRLLVWNSEKDVHIEYRLEKKSFQNGILDVMSYGKPILMSDDGMAFDHSEILLEGLLRVRNKTEYTDIIFNVLPEKFRIKEMLDVYQLLAGRVEYQTNIRKKMRDKIEDTGDVWIPDHGGRKAKLYRYRNKK